MTPSAPKHSISPESSDGFASVGTILPKEKAAPLPGGLFMSLRGGFVLLGRIVVMSATGSAEERASSEIPRTALSRVSMRVLRLGVAGECHGMALRHRTRKIKLQ